jgi:hypothetical protein
MPATPGPDRPISLEQLAHSAAGTARTAPAAGPADWIYRKSAVVPDPELAGDPVITERWATADHALAAAWMGDDLQVGPWAWPVGPDRQARKIPIGIPAVTYADLITLPGDPSAVAGFLASIPVPRAAEWQAGHAFEMIAEIFQRYVPPPQTTALLYQTVEVLPGVTVSAAATDPAGRPAARFRLANPGGTVQAQEILVTPGRHRFAGYQFLADGHDPRSEMSWGMAELTQAKVSGPGVRP